MRELEKPWKFQLRRSETISQRREDLALGDGWHSKGLGSGLRIKQTTRMMNGDSQPVSLIEAGSGWPSPFGAHAFSAWRDEEVFVPHTLFENFRRRANYLFFQVFLFPCLNAKQRNKSLDMPELFW